MAAPGMVLRGILQAGPRIVPASMGLRFLVFVFLLAHFALPRIVWAEPLQQVVLPPAEEATGAGWAAVALSGSVLYRTPDRRDWRPLARSQVLQPEFEVVTGVGGFAKLVRGHDEVTIEENAHLVFPASNGPRSETSILQFLGTAFFKVTKRNRWHFEVKTPFLAAVVKGTSFRVSVARAGASVDVESGLVGVSNAAGDRSVDVDAGRTVSVASSGGGLSVGATAKAEAAAPDGSGANENAEKPGDETTAGVSLRDVRSALGNAGRDGRDSASRQTSRSHSANSKGKGKDNAGDARGRGSGRSGGNGRRGGGGDDNDDD